MNLMSSLWSFDESRLICFVAKNPDGVGDKRYAMIYADVICQIGIMHNEVISHAS